MKNILILGIGSDVGQALARKFASEGNSIWLAARDMDFLKVFQKDLEIRYSVPVQSFYFDAGIYSSHALFFQNLPTVPDICIYVIGYMGKNNPQISDWADTLKILDANYIGAVSIFNILGEAMKTRGSGVMVGISSVAGERGRKSNYLYGSAKAGFSAYLSGLRNALYAHGVQVITVKPGFIYTSMTEGLSLPPMLTAKATEVADSVYGAIEKRKDIIYIKWFWKWIMWIIRNIPEKIFKKLSL